MRLTELYDPKFLAQTAAANAAANACAGADDGVPSSSASKHGHKLSTTAASALHLDQKHITPISTVAATTQASPVGGITDRTPEHSARSAASDASGRPGSSQLPLPKVDVRVVANGARSHWNWSTASSTASSANKPKLVQPSAASAAASSSSASWSSLVAAVFNCIAAHSQSVSDGNFLWENIHAQDKSGVPKFNPTGRYTIRLFVLGEWRAVTIDDTIPVDADLRPLLPILSSSTVAMPSLVLPTPNQLRGNGNGTTTGNDRETEFEHPPSTAAPSQSVAAAKKDAAKLSKAEKERADTILVEVWPLLLSKALLKLAAGYNTMTIPAHMLMLF
jgi:hypothetical protein